MRNRIQPTSWEIIQMNANFYSLIALDIARERSLEAERHWLASSLAYAAPDRKVAVRHMAATALAAVSRSAANAVRRLDSRVADDLRRTLAPAE
jgi:hypothetical protein